MGEFYATLQLAGSAIVCEEKAVLQGYVMASKGCAGYPQTYDAEVAGCPGATERVANARTVTGCFATKDCSYRSTRVSGDGWVLVGDAFGFLDPLHSSGILLALKSGELAADAIAEGLAEGDTSAARLGRWGPGFNEGVDRMRRRENRPAGAYRQETSSGFPPTRCGASNAALRVNQLREPQPQANRYRSKVWLSHVCPSSQVDEQARMDCEVDTRTKLAAGGVAACGLAYTRRAGVDFVDAVALEVKSDSCCQPRLKYPFEIQDVARPHAYLTHAVLMANGASGALLPGICEHEVRAWASEQSTRT